MRKLRLWAAAFCGVGVLGAGMALADGETKAVRGAAAVAHSVEGELTFHLASSTPVVGFDRVVLNKRDTVYISPQAAFGSAEIVATLPDLAAGGLVVQLTAATAKELATRKTDRVAVFDGAELIAVPSAVMTADLVSLDIGTAAASQIQKITGTLGSVVPNRPTVSLVPRESVVQPGGLLTVDAFINRVANLRAYQVAVDAFDAQGGKLALDGITMETKRQDYVFAGVGAVDAVDLHGSRLTAAMFQGGTDLPGLAYAGTFTFQVPEDAAGSVLLRLRSGFSTVLRSPAGTPIAFQIGAPVRVTVGLTDQPAIGR